MGRAEFRYLNVLMETDRAVSELRLPELPHFHYFELCLSAHHATVATFVPTDVDNQIRSRLWSQGLPTEVLLSMAELVLESKLWDERPVSTRTVCSPSDGYVISGHRGEWFSTAAAGYGALRRRAPEMASALAAEIVSEVRREAALFDELKKARDGIAMLKTATLIAHNLGDLDRVIEMWNLPDEDPLKQAVFKAGHAGKDKTLTAAGLLNKAHMADENHRHFALRTPRCLRRSRDFLLPIGPFFDEWGARIARHPDLSEKDAAGVAEALLDGWERLRKGGNRGPVGYARALAGMLETFPGGLNGLCQFLPAKAARALKSGDLRSLCSVPRKRFEEQWAQFALRS